MMILIYLILALLNEVVSNGSSDNEQIHVPEIIEHRIHTKTVYVHVHKPVSRKKEKPRKKETPTINREEDHRENWSSWKTYDYKENHEDKHTNIYDRSKNHNAGNDYNDHKDPMDTHKHSSPYFNNEHLGNVKDSYLPESDVYGGNYDDSNQKGNNKDTESNDVPVSYHYEEGYRRGLHSETGHKYADKLNQFIDDKHEESEASKNDYEQQSEKYKDEGRTHAGRYLVDESEFEDDDSKYEETNHAARKRKTNLSSVNDKEVQSLER